MSPDVASLATAGLLAIDTLLFHGHEASNVSGFPNPGTWLIFAVILMPIYVMIGAWYIGRPHDVRTATMGVVYLVGITTAVWVSMFVATEVIGLIFF